MGSGHANASQVFKPQAGLKVSGSFAAICKRAAGGAISPKSKPWNAAGFVNENPEIRRIFSSWPANNRNIKRNVLLLTAGASGRGQLS